jgi:hypothetical protein
MIYLSEAITALRPGEEWTLDGDDVENIRWNNPNVQPLTRAEVDSEIARLTAAQATATAAAAANAAAAIAHAKSLGFTDAMISAMYPALVAG